jgi:hypothetical protein
VAIGLSTEVRGLRETLMELKALDKTLYDQLNSDIKNASLPFARGIENALPTNAPLTGFSHSGATAFRSSDNKTEVKTGRKKPRGNTPTALLKVVVKGRGLGIADIAGRRNARGRTSGRSKPSARRPTGYRLNGQGTKMIEKLNENHRSIGIGSKNGASRFVWPAAFKNQNLIDNSIERSLQEASAKVNRNLLVVK